MEHLGTSVHFVLVVLGFQENSMIFDFLIIEFLLICQAMAQNSRKRYTVRLLSMCLGSSTLRVGGKAPPPLLVPLDGLLLA